MDSLFRRPASGISGHPQSVYNPSGMPRMLAFLHGYGLNVKALNTPKVHKWRQEKPTQLNDLATCGWLFVCQHVIFKRKVLLKVLKGKVLLEDLVSDEDEYIGQLCECTNLYHINREQYYRRVRPQKWCLPQAAPSQITQIISICLAAPGSLAAPSRRFPHGKVRKVLQELQYPLCRH